MLIQSDFAIPPVKAEITQHLKYDIAMGVDPKEFELGCSKKNLFYAPNSEPNITKNMAVF